MWPFKPKQDTIESLIKDCNKLYASFKYSYTLAHYESYYDLKKSMKDNFQLMQKTIGLTDNEDSMKELLKHFKNQLSFFEKNPFSCTPEDLNTFKNAHFPYQQKMEEIMKSPSSSLPSQSLKCGCKIHNH